MIDIFTMPAPPARAMWPFLAIGLLLIGLLVMFGYFAFSSQKTRYEVSAEGLTIHAAVYGRSLPWSSLDVLGARVVRLAEERDYQPTLRTNGLGLPGYQAGWFRLRRAGKGLLFLTDRSRVVMIPTRLGYTILLSASEPEGLVEALRRWGGG